MTPDQLDTLLHALTKANDESTKQAVEKHVNGYIRELNRKLDNHVESSAEHWKITQEFMTALLPVKEGLGTVQGIVKVIKWGAPVGAIVAYLYSKL
jgi:hypothetical protein